MYVGDSASNKGLWSWKYSVNEPCPSISCVKRVQTPPDVGLDNASFTQGVRIGSAKDGVVRAYIPPIMGSTGPTKLTERLTVDANGDVFLAEGRTMHLRKYVKN